MSLQKKNASVKLLIQPKFVLNIAKIGSLFAMAIQQLNPKTQACQYPYWYTEACAKGRAVIYRYART